jgi:chemotaxis protein MotA
MKALAKEFAVPVLKTRMITKHFVNAATIVMENLSAPSKLGAGIAVAFVATIYGVGLANLFLLPFANKLKSLVRREVQFRELVIEGIVAIAEGENPRNIEAKPQGFLH